MNSSSFLEKLSSNLGALTSWNPQGLSRPVMGLLYLYLIPNTKLNTVPEESQGQISLIRSWTRPIRLPSCPLQIHPHDRPLRTSKWKFSQRFPPRVFRRHHSAPEWQPHSVGSMTPLSNHVGELSLEILCKLFHYLRFGPISRRCQYFRRHSLELWED